MIKILKKFSQTFLPTLHYMTKVQMKTRVFSWHTGPFRAQGGVQVVQVVQDVQKTSAQDVKRQK